MGLFLACLFSSIDLWVCFCVDTILFITVGLWFNLKSWCMIPPAVVFSLKITLALRGPLCFHTIKKIIFGWAGSSLLCGLFSSCGETGLLLSSCGPWASHCSGFSCCRAQTFRHAGFSSWSTWTQQLQPPRSGAQAQQLWRMGLVISRHVGSSWTRDWTLVSCPGRHTLYLWATGECPIRFLELFVVVLWKMSLVFWEGLHWICRLICVVCSFNNISSPNLQAQYSFHSFL